MELVCLAHSKLTLALLLSLTTVSAPSLSQHPLSALLPLVVLLATQMLNVILELLETLLLPKVVVLVEANVLEALTVKPMDLVFSAETILTVMERINNQL